MKYSFQLSTISIGSQNRLASPGIYLNDNVKNDII